MQTRITKKKSDLKPVTYRIPPALEEAIIAMASAKGMATNTMVNNLLLYAVKELRDVTHGEKMPPLPF